MAKNDKNATQLPSEAEKPVEQIDALAPTDLRIVEVARAFTLKHVNAVLHEKVNAGFDSITKVLKGFVKNGNRTDYRRAGVMPDGTEIDPELFASACVEPLKDEPGKFALVISSMEGCRPADVFYQIADHVSKFVYPATPRADLKADGTPKMESHTKERNDFIKGSLGFARTEMGGGKRWITKKEGVEQMLQEIEALVPVLFNGTAAPERPNRVTVQFLLPARYIGGKVSRNLVDPEVAEGKDALKEALAKDLEWVTVCTNGPDALAFADPTKPVAKAYLALIQREQAPQQEAAAA